MKTTALAEKAQELLDAMGEALASGGRVEHWTAYETAEGGLALIEEFHAGPESLLWSRGAKRVWRVRRAGGRLIAEGYSAEGCCRLEAPAPATPALRLLHREIPYELRPEGQ